jgi:phage head maturation protease
MRFKRCTAFKMAPDTTTEDGQFEAIVSVFGNKDSVGDVVMPGAFTASIAEWHASGDPLPVLWSHRMDDPRFSIGHVIEAEELAAGDPRIPPWSNQWLKENGGLWVKGQLHTGPDASDVGVAARRLLKNRLVTQFSYAYDIIDGGWGTASGEDVYELRTLKLHEVSPTQLGANDLTTLVGAKAAVMGAAPAVRRLIAELHPNDLREALAVIGTVLAEQKADGGTVDAGQVKAEEPAGVKAEEPARLSAASVRLLGDLMSQWVTTT